MSERINDGGPAFPRDHTSDGHNGVPLRDYFATHIDPEAKFNDVEFAEELLGRKLPEDFAGRLQFGIDLAAKIRYMMADAMLAAREAKS